MAVASSGSDSWGTRTAHDLSGLFVEWSRLLKAVSFYPVGHPVREEMRDRAYQAWTIELERAGSIELVRKEMTLHCQTPSCQIEPTLVQSFVASLEAHGIEHLLFIPKLDLETFSVFSEMLTAPNAYNDPHFCERFYAATSGGIEIDRVPHEGHEPDSADILTSASLGSALLNAAHQTPDDLLEPGAVRVAATEPTPGADLEPAGEAPPAAPPTTTPTTTPTATPTTTPTATPTTTPTATPTTTPTTTPTATTTTPPTADPLGLALEQLESCTNDSYYRSLLDRIARELRSPSRSLAVADSYRFALLLADHAAGQAGSSGAQAHMAQLALEALCDGPILDHIMDRTCSHGSGEVRAAQVLLRLGERAVPAILERLQLQQRLEDRAQLSAIIIALGEHAIPELTVVINDPANQSTQLAVRLAGEIQNPKIVPVLVGVLKERGTALREEAARALVHIGNSEACEALVMALAADDEELRIIAATHLGVLRDERTCVPLIRALDRAWRERRMRVCVVLIHSIGQLTTHREEVDRRLGEILHRRRLVWRKKERPCKLAALGVLNTSTSLAARRAVVYATSDPDSVIAERARELLGGAEES